MGHSNTNATSRTVPTSAPSVDDWRRVLGQFGDVLQKICESEPVRSDERCQQIILDMVGADMPYIDAQMKLLTLRVGELLAAKTGDETVMTRLTAQSTASERVTSLRSNRTFLKL